MSKRWPLSVRLWVDEEWMETLTEMAGYSIGYWARSATVTEDAYIVRWTDEAAQEKRLSFGSLARAAQRIVSEPSLVNENTRSLVMDSIYDAGDIDGDVADVVVQVATFGRIVYG